MRYRLEIEPADIVAVHQLLEAYQLHPFVRGRHERNVVLPPAATTRDWFWASHLMCLLTTQNKSGAGSAVDTFLRQRPFPLTWEVCQSAQDVGGLIYDMLSELGIRRWKVSSGFVQQNFRRLQDGGWEALETWSQKLLAQRAQVPESSHYILERDASRAVQGLLKGIGPKQSRNFWQDIGLTRYEIPLDSRILRWLRGRMDFYIPASGLADERFYCQVMDVLRDLALAAGVLPCMLDAAVFASFEP
ncbi:MAG TPA: hypothetical protein PKM21_19115 [Anaerolineales bacterium]|nr:hypothetical protein [Anaerolineales bacterium]